MSIAATGTTQENINPAFGITVPEANNFGNYKRMLRMAPIISATRAIIAVLPQSTAYAASTAGACLSQVKTFLRINVRRSKELIRLLRFLIRNCVYSKSLSTVVLRRHSDSGTPYFIRTDGSVASSERRELGAEAGAGARAGTPVTAQVMEGHLKN